MKQWEREETDGERAKRLAWRASAADSVSVAGWLRNNPPPKDWDGEALDWAYLEMTFPPHSFFGKEDDDG